MPVGHTASEATLQQDVNFPNLLEALEMLVDKVVTMRALSPVVVWGSGVGGE
jgi:uncharacterized membrane protein